MKWPRWRGAPQRADVLGINRRNLDLVFADYRPGQFRDLDDKLRGKERLKLAGVPIPETVAVLRNAGDAQHIGALLAKCQEIVIKPAKGWGGRGILVLERMSGDLWRTPADHQFTAQALREHVEQIQSGAFSLDESEDRAILEERIHPHPFFAEIYPHGLSDLRVIVEDGTPIQAMLRVPTDASDGKANLHGGGLGLGIDLETGRIVRAIQRQTTVEVHPDTEVRLLGREVPEWSRCLDVARAAARAVEPIRYVGVDLVFDVTRGPLVLELNARPGLQIQLANQSAQPVRRRMVLSRLDRVTQRTSWFVLFFLAVAPWLFLRVTANETPELRAVQGASARQEPDASSSEDMGAMEWSDEDATISSRSSQFAQARAAAAAGDTLRALELYREAAQDSSLTAFAVNNIALLERSRGELAQARAHLESVTASYPAYMRAVYNLGLVLRDQGDLRGSEMAFRRSLALHPAHAGSWSEFGELLLARGATDSACLALAQAIRFQPDAVADRRRLARALLISERPGAAATRYAQALALAPGNESAAIGWVNARLEHAARQDLSLANSSAESLRAALKPHLHARAPLTAERLASEVDWWGGNSLVALERLRSFEPKALDASLLAMRALLAIELGIWDDASACLRAAASPRLSRLQEAIDLGRALEAADAGNFAAARVPSDSLLNFAYHVAAGDDLQAQGNALPKAIDATEQAFVRAAAQATGEWDALGELTPARLRRGSASSPPPIPGSLLLWAASRDLQALSTLDRRFPEFRPRRLLRILQVAAQPEPDASAAKAAYDLGVRLLRANPEDPGVLLAMTELQLNRGRLPSARAYFDRLDAESKTRRDVRRIEARLWLELGELRNARRAFAALAEESPLDSDAWRWLAASQMRAGRDREAVASWERALQLVPEDSNVRQQFADTLMQLRRYDEAAAQWRLLANLQLPEAEARSVQFQLALSLQRAERLEAALTAWDELLRHEPESRSAVYNRALALERLGRSADAIAGFQRVLQIDPAHQASRARLAKLQNAAQPAAGNGP